MIANILERFRKFWRPLGALVLCSALLTPALAQTRRKVYVRSGDPYVICLKISGKTTFLTPPELSVILKSIRWW